MAVSPEDERPPRKEIAGGKGGESEPDEARVPAGSPTPEAQTPQEVAEHGNGHCMRIKAQFAPYKAATAVQSEEHSVLEVSLDDPFMEGEGLSFQKEQAQDVMPRVVMYDHKTRGCIPRMYASVEKLRSTTVTMSKVIWNVRVTNDFL